MAVSMEVCVLRGVGLFMHTYIDANVMVLDSNCIAHRHALRLQLHALAHSPSGGVYNVSPTQEPP